MKAMIRITAPLLIAVTVGCTYEENLAEKDLVGTVRVPMAALEITLIDDEGNERTIPPDPRALGPVYLGAFASVEEGHYDYPHPEMGPILDADYPGNTYPYGGTTVGRFDWGCYEQLVCKVVTGRYSGYDDVLGFFADVLESPVTAPDGHEVNSAVEYQEHCFEREYVTSDAELAFVANEPYFTQSGDYLEAEVSIPHALFKEGMSIWGWVDMPSPTFSFVTCNESVGEYHYKYSEQYYKGTNYPDVLNYPGLYIDSGDWVVETPAIINDPTQAFEVEIGYHYED